MVRVRNSFLSNTSPRVELIFQITQHLRGGGGDKNLINSFIDYLGCGRGVFFYYYYNKNKTRERKGGLAVDFLVYKFSDLNSEIIPLFETYSILGVKFSEFNDFCSVVTLKNNSAHTLFFFYFIRFFLLL